MDNIQVDKDYRRKGVGSELLQGFESHTGGITADFRPQGMSDSELEEFYKKNGCTVENGRIRRV
ncbi:GNAT family N-acetyltransferase [Candidatus Woesebacteria bacterium]|nr:MAG: GNAT family N-acetyltransferase [Candidatus Woesebacteria bacterium]